jgi:FMN phosphatase YigB (HAD superfamily)
MHNSMPKHLILDIGKVLVTYEHDSLLFSYLQEKQEFPLEPAKTFFQQHTHQLNIGKITFPQFMKKFNQKFCTHFTSNDFFAAKRRNSNFNWELVSYCKKHKTHFDTSILSGNHKAIIDWYSGIFKFTTWTKVRVYSYQHGTNKDTPKLFLIILKKLHAQPQDCVFVDDKDKFVLMAKSVGMHAITYNGDNNTLFLQLDKIFMPSPSAFSRTHK